MFGDWDDLVCLLFCQVPLNPVALKNDTTVINS